MSNLEKDMTSGPIKSQILIFALPLILANTLQQVYSTVDTVVLGMYSGIDSMAVLGTSSWVVWFLVSVITSYSQAVSMVMAKYFGASDRKRVKLAFATGHIAGAVLCAAMILAVLLLKDPILRLLNTPPEIMEDSRIYLKITVIGSIGLMLYNLEAAVLRAIGDSRTPLMAILSASVINIGLDIWFVKKLGMGVRGVSVATVTAQWFSALVCLVKVRRIPQLKMSWKDWKADGYILRECGYLAVPMLIQSFVIAFGGFVVQNKINSYGTLFAGGMSATGRFFGLLETSAIALAQSVSIFVSQNKGAGHLDRIKKGVRSGVAISMVIASLLCVSMFFFGKQILSVFVSPEEALEYAWEYLLVMSGGLLIMYPMYTLRHSMQALGNAVIPMIGGIVQLFARVFSAWYMTSFMEENALYFSCVLSWATSLVIMGYFYPLQLKKIKKKGIDRL
mgnify:CR=1 FL=1